VYVSPLVKKPGVLFKLSFSSSRSQYVAQIVLRTVLRTSSRKISSTGIPSHQESNGDTVGTIVLCFFNMPFSFGTHLFDSTLTVVCSDDAGKEKVCVYSLLSSLVVSVIVYPLMLFIYQQDKMITTIKESR
jgi:hypothetical protein